MKKYSVESKNSLTALNLILCFLLISSYAEGQSTTSDLVLDEYQIIGKDTRTYTITGDRISTVEFLNIPLKLPEEKRSIETSQGLIGNDERLWRKEQVEVGKGVYSHANIFTGSRTLSDLWGKASLDMGTIAGTVRILNCAAKENTPANNAPLTQKINATGYFGSTGVRFSADFGFTRENDELYEERFRGRARQTERYRAGLAMRTPLGKTWDAKGGITFSGGTFKDSEINYSNNEFVIGGNISATGDIHALTVVFDSAVDYLELEDDSGSIFSSGLKGNILLWDGAGIQAGAVFYASEMPGGDTEVRVYPDVKFDMAISRSSFIRIFYKPEVKRHSYGELYDVNGLILPVPMLFEDRKNDVRGEIGWRFRPDWLISLCAFYTQSENSLVFNRSGDFFTIIKDAEVDLNGFSFKTSSTNKETWGLESEFKFNNVSWWNEGGEVPYIPAGEFSLSGYLAPKRKWILRGSLRFMGKHFVELGSKEFVKSFITIDCGIERELWKSLGVFIDIRNITNNSGSWWTDKYKMPGIGLYTGLKTNL
ncbi:hypothetical protein ACFL1R_01360 [Candidatus Latescibacterota bacterium]